MEKIVDLTAELQVKEGKNAFYKITGVIHRMLAPQNLSRPFTYKKTGWGSVEKIESNVDGTPTEKRAPRTRSNIRKGESEIQCKPCWTFKVCDNALMLPWASEFGIFKTSLRRSLEAQRKLRYDSAPLSLMKVFPEELNVGKAPCESMQKERLPEIHLEKRNTARGNTMVDAFFDFIEERSFTCYIEIDSEAPINQEKLVALITSLNTLDNVGPSKRGSLEVTNIMKVTLSSDEKGKLRKGELPD